MAATTVYKLYRHFVWAVAAEQKRLNDDLVMESPGIEVEADEIALRCFERDDGALVRMAPLVRHGCPGFV